MTDILLWFAVAASLGAGFFELSRRKMKLGIDFSPASMLAIGAGLILPLAMLFFAQSARPDLGRLIEFAPYLIGAAAALVAAALFDGEESPSWAGVAGLAASPLLVMKGLDVSLASSAFWSALLGIASTSVALAFVGKGRAALFLTPILAAIGSLAVFGVAKEVTSPMLWPAALAAGAALAGVIASLLPEAGWKPAASSIGLALISMAAGKFIANSNEMALVCGVAVVIAIALAFLMPKDKPAAFHVGAAALVWLGVATFGFSQGQGTGMASAAAIGAAALILLGRTDLMASLAPLAAFTLYRVFREGYSDLSRAFDIGQYYGGMGVLAAVTLLLILSEESERSRSRGPWPGVTLALIAGIVLATLGLHLGAKGVVGLMIGCGLAPALLLFKGGKTVENFAAALGSIAFLGVIYKGLIPLLDLARSEKQIWLYSAAGIVLVLAAAYFSLVRSKQEGEYVAP